MEKNILASLNLNEFNICIKYSWLYTVQIVQVQFDESNVFNHQSTKYIPNKNCVSAYETESHTISRDVNFSRYQDFVTKHSIKFV